MPDLPGRPDLGQLRRQARDLQRAAASGDADALHQVRSVAEEISLSAAQLAIARDHGFASWPRLKAEAERRRAAVSDCRTGRGRDLSPAPAAFLAEPARRAARPDHRPVRGPARAAARPGGGGGRGGLVRPATVEARRTLVSLVSPRRVFAVVKATTKSRVDLGLRLEGGTPGGRLQGARNLGSGAATVRIALTSPDDVDEEVVGSAPPRLRAEHRAARAAAGCTAAPRISSGPFGRDPAHYEGRKAEGCRRTRFLQKG